ncbi:hypothetical protein [Spirosoma foliorum]|uniref:Uncharacterized protein n=1 Tax=Spirosoma foliorum TaxID=2710596 RepID=A0A7G5H4X7_9BACT|nr:hypothetical protein [Spirosoma foliorum]QMW06169.1 hypothetical protein H3H32_15395 [Spirosoma foliorum]
MKKGLSFICLLLSFVSPVLAQKQATWIWYPGDFEIWLGNNMQNRRTERTIFLPPFWKLDSHYNLIDFHKDFDLTQAEAVNYLPLNSSSQRKRWKL